MAEIRIEKDGNEWVAVLPPHPDMPDEELGLPAATREEAEAEGQAYRAIEQSSLYKFDFDEGKGCYVVSIGKEGEKYEAPLLAEAYRQAQEAYTKRVSEPPPPDPAPPPKAKPGRKPKQQGNGAPTPTAPAQAVEPDPNITSGIGDKPTQLKPPTHEQLRTEAREPWTELNERVTNLENVLRGAVEATAKALEALKK